MMAQLNKLSHSPPVSSLPTPPLPLPRNQNNQQAQIQQNANQLNPKLSTNKNHPNNFSTSGEDSSLFLQSDSSRLTAHSNNKNTNTNHLAKRKQLLREEDSQSSLSEPSLNKAFARAKANENNHTEFFNGTHAQSMQQQENSKNNKNDQEFTNNAFEMYQNALSRSPSPKNQDASSKKPLQTQHHSSPQLWKIDQDLNAAKNKDIQAILLRNLGNQNANANNNNNNNNANNVKSSSQSVNDNDDLFLKSNRHISNKVPLKHKPHENINNTNSNHRTSSLVQSPSETFGTIFQPISHNHTSPHNRSLPNSVINSIGTFIYTFYLQ